MTPADNTKQQSDCNNKTSVGESNEGKNTQGTAGGGGGALRKVSRKPSQPIEPAEIVRGAHVKAYDPHGGWNIVYLFGKWG